MKFQVIQGNLSEFWRENNQLYDFVFSEKSEVNVYTNSFIEKDGILFFLGKEKDAKFLFLVSESQKEIYDELEGEEINNNVKKKFLIKKCSLTTSNRKKIQQIFSFTRPQLIGLNNSFGFGDRLGLANAGHIKALATSNFKPVLAQQSVRELIRTNRNPEAVIDAAVWAVFQSGYKNGFGADADHLKSIEDIDRMMHAGFTMFTFDPGDYIDNGADTYDEERLYRDVAELPWDELNDSFISAEKKYANKNISVTKDFSINVGKSDLLRAYCKYGKAIVQIKKMHDYLFLKRGTNKFEVEISIDESNAVTSPFEHYFIASELSRLNVKFISLAPRFIGSFEKGIDYKGDLNIFKAEYEKHAAIVKHFGSYKLSLHSGSDKFSIYKIMSVFKDIFVHIKTSGTSYIEALKVIAVNEPSLFREILEYSKENYDKEKQSYHVSAETNLVKFAQEYSDEELIYLFEDNNVRQILHVTFGGVLSDKNQNGNYRFKERIIQCVAENEKIHYDFLIKHFYKHLRAFT